MKLTSLSALLIPILLSGCASSFNTKSADFGCSGMPDGVKCLSVKDVYSATESSDFVNGEVAERWRNNQSNGNNARQVAPQNQGNTVIPAADKPLPLRTPAKVMRMWIAPYEDQGDLYAGQYVFSEIQGRKWSVGTQESTQSESISPLQSTAAERNAVRETDNPLRSKK